LICYTEHGFDEHEQTGSENMEIGHADWLQDYALYLAGLNLTFLPREGVSELEVDTLMGSDGWPVSGQIRLNPATLAVLRATTCVCVTAIIDRQNRKDCWGCAYNCPSQRRHTCMNSTSRHHYESHYDDICAVLDRYPFQLLLKTVLKNTTGLSVAPAKFLGVAESMLCDLLSETYVMDKLEININLVMPEHQSKIFEATRMWKRTLALYRRV